jgi:S-adenosylmethionine:tRNA ribosyltransferase-isomerase
MSAVRFELPRELEADAPPARRDSVRLLVARPHGLTHATFAELGAQLAPGDLLVVNTSATLPSAVDGWRADGRDVLVHFSSELDDGRWAVEFRRDGRSSGPLDDVRVGERVALPDGVELRVVAPYPVDREGSRLWRVEIALEGDVHAFLGRRGRPIRYGYVPVRFPLADYQTVFARQPGSAEMPSAGRPFTAELVTDLVSRGVLVAPLLLHTGVSSAEEGEPPYPEPFEVPVTTAQLVNATRWAGRRVIAVGTTVTRALESAVDDSGLVRPRRGWTDLVLHPGRPARVVTGLITGWHAPGASHLQLLQSVAGSELVQRAYTAAVHERYRWHEFGDSALLLP